MRIRLPEAESGATLIRCLRATGHIAYLSTGSLQPGTIEVIEPASADPGATIAVVLAWWEEHPDVALEFLAAA